LIKTALILIQILRDFHHPSPSRQTPRKYRFWAMTTSFQILSNLLFAIHPTEARDSVFG
jgi:hypothetical protein